MAPFGRRSGGRSERSSSGSADFLIVGLGNPGSRYAGTRHNVGFDVAEALSSIWDLPRAKKRFGGLIAEGRPRPGGPRVAILLPQTFMNESGNSAGPARGSLGVDLDRVIASTKGFSFADIEEVKNLLIRHFIDSGEWDWPNALEQFTSNRHDLGHRSAPGFRGLAGSTLTTSIC